MTQTILQVNICSEICLCFTCRRYIWNGQIPKICLANGLNFPEIPNEMKGITELEERLVAPRLPFMQIRLLGIDKQFGVRGNVVNIPIQIQKSIEVLPRAFSETETIQLLLKRMRQHKSSYINEYIRPLRVYKAAKYLIKQPLYVEEGITIALNWTETHNSMAEPFIVDNIDKTDQIEQSNDITIDTIDDWDETAGEQNVNPGSEQTLLKEGLVFAPGEGVKPVSLLGDEYAEELSFPTIYCGQKRQLTLKLTYNEIVKSELRRYDRRCCKIPKIFYSYRKKEILALRNAISICLRKNSQQSSLTAGEIRNSDTITQLLNSDKAYKVLAGDRSSPAYWQQKMRELMAMVRQLGVPTFFLTLSAAETHWHELLMILVKVLHGKSITKEEALQMSYVDKCNLIRADPVTCSRYFDHRFRELFKLIQADQGPFSGYSVVDSYCRIEFQHRGSPHVHCLLWLDGAPQYFPESEESKHQCEEFIDKFITCSSLVDETKNLIKYQYHKHSKTCKRFRDDTAICRFGIPYYPMSRTIILDELDLDSLNNDQIDKIEINLDKINNKLKEIDLLVRKSNLVPVMTTFEQFLKEVDITENDYLLAIRYTLKRSQVFLKRCPADIRINGFNNKILIRHRANMDLQFVLDPYSCVHYILNYINKSNRGMSALIRSVVEDCKSGYVSHQQKLYCICSAFMNCSEVSAQEAVYVLLSMPLSIASRPTIFINTSERDRRTRILKAERDLRDLDPDSKDIMVLGLLEYYVLRPEELDSICLAEFAANYNYSKTKKWKSDDEQHENDDEQILTENQTNDQVYKIKNNKGWIRKRDILKVIRYRKYQLEKDANNYFREKCMLYLPWRDEDRDLITIDCNAKYRDNIEQIKSIEQQFVYNLAMDYDKLQYQVESDIRAEINDSSDEEINDEYAVYDLQRQESTIEQEFVQNKSASHNDAVRQGAFAGPTLMVDDKYQEIIRCLNPKQRKYLLETMNLVKTNKTPFYHFVTGGAGTGKSVLISSLYQSLMRYYAFRFPEAADKTKILLLGPTGKSAFHIGGSTIHSALGIPVNQNNSLPVLSADTKSTYRNKYWHLKTIIIDEISMVGAKAFLKMDNQLKQIFDSKEPFGGKSVLCFGDFNQLPPVIDNYVFEHASNFDYSVLAGTHLWQLFSFYRLDEIMRQKNDLSFANALNNLSTGDLNNEDLSLFQSRLFNKSSDKLPKTAIKLFPKNVQVDEYNSLAINRWTGQGYSVEAFDFITQIMDGRTRNQALYSISKMPTKNTYGLPKIVELKVGIRYMISTNIDIADGLVNGTTGILCNIDMIKDKDNNNVPNVLWFDFDSNNIGLRAKSSAHSRMFGNKYLTPIMRVIRDIQTKTEIKIVLVCRRQFPLVPAEAITINKAQGQTYEQIVLDLSQKLTLAQMYTGCSRAKSANGLFLTGDRIRFPAKRSEEHKVVKELRRLETNAKLVFNLRFLTEMKINQESISVFYQNIPYLAKHVSDLLVDSNINAAQLLTFVETRGNSVTIPGYRLIAQLEAIDNRPFGIAFYCQDQLVKMFGKIIESNCMFYKGAHLEYLVIEFGANVFVTIYASPNYPKKITIQKLIELVQRLFAQRLPITVVGDLNIDRIKEKTIVEQIERIGLNCCLASDTPTNAHGNQIDWIFSSAKKIEAWVYESLSVDHKPIFAIV